MEKFEKRHEDIFRKGSREEIESEITDERSFERIELSKQKTIEV